MAPSSEPRGSVGGTGSGHAQLPAPRVLLVDDQPFFLTMGRNMLGPEGYEIRTASSGAEALEAVRAAPPDAILLDVEMPGMDGFETCRRLKANPATAGIPVVILTATLDPKLNERASKAGAEATVLKSVSAERLLNMLQIALTMERSTDPTPGGPDRGHSIL